MEQKKIFCFGNPLVSEDDSAIRIAEELGGELPGFEFVLCETPDSLVPYMDRDIVIMDSVKGIKNVRIIRQFNVDKININRIVGLHDYDLGLFLKLMKGLGKKNNITIIGLPMNISDKNIEKIKEGVKDGLKLLA